MPEKLDLVTLLEEIKADEAAEPESGAAQVSQDQIGAMLANRRKRRHGEEKSDEGA